METREILKVITEIRKEIKQKENKTRESIRELLEKELDLREELGRRIKEEEEEQKAKEEIEQSKEIQEINIESPIWIRKRHMRERAKWIKKERENTELETRRIMRQKKRVFLTRNNMCRVENCYKERDTGKTLCKEHAKYYKGLKRR